MTAALQSSAKRHLRAAVAFGWATEALACDYALKAMEAEGHDQKAARSAIRAVWARDFDVTQPY